MGSLGSVRCCVVDHLGTHNSGDLTIPLRTALRTGPVKTETGETTRLTVRPIIPFAVIGAGWSVWQPNRSTMAGPTWAEIPLGLGRIAYWCPLD